jgi:hypothetical protein
MEIESSARLNRARPLLTLRVSRDGGRTWGPTKEIFADDCSPYAGSEFPLCACPKCRATPALRPYGVTGN